jgi:Flp pilus assembly protein TadG
MTRRADQGLAPVETAIAAPVFIAFVLLAVLAGRVTQADHIVQRAASEAARAASLHDRPAGATADATEVVDASLADAGLACTPTTSVDTSDLRPGGRVTVTVTCTVSMADLSMLGVPGSRTVTATSVEIIDRYRSTTGDAP